MAVNAASARLKRRRSQTTADDDSEVLNWEDVITGAETEAHSLRKFLPPRFNAILNRASVEQSDGSAYSAVQASHVVAQQDGEHAQAQSVSTTPSAKQERLSSPKFSTHRLYLPHGRGSTRHTLQMCWLRQRPKMPVSDATKTNRLFSTPHSFDVRDFCKFQSLPRLSPCSRSRVCVDEGNGVGILSLPPNKLVDSWSMENDNIISCIMDIFSDENVSLLDDGQQSTPEDSRLDERVIIVLCQWGMKSWERAFFGGPQEGRNISSLSLPQRLQLLKLLESPALAEYILRTIPSEGVRGGSQPPLNDDTYDVWKRLLVEAARYSYSSCFHNMPVTSSFIRKFVNSLGWSKCGSLGRQIEMDLTLLYVSMNE
jgi:hypothetical protein